MTPTHDERTMIIGQLSGILYTILKFTNKEYGTSDDKFLALINVALDSVQQPPLTEYESKLCLSPNIQKMDFSNFRDL